MALTPVTGFDSFSRSVTDGWGTSDSGHVWLGEDSTFDVYHSSESYGYGRILLSSAGTKVAYWAEGHNSTAEVLCKFRWSTSNLTEAGPVLRYQDENNYLYCALADYNHAFYILKVVDGVATQLTGTAKVFSSNTYYWVRFRAEASTAYIRVWEDGDEEPSVWGASTSSLTGTAAGDIGFRAKYRDSSYTVDLDSYYFYSLEDAEPGLPVTDTFERDVHKGFGMADTDHLWDGHVSDSPVYYLDTLRGTVVDDTDGYGEIIIPSAGNSVQALIGPVAQDTEAYALVSASTVTGNPIFRLALRGNDAGVAGETFEPTWYYAYLVWGTGVLRIYDYSAVQIGSTYTLSPAPAAGEKWHIKFKAEGTSGSMALSAKAWEDGNSEPGWLVTGTGTSPYRNSGRGGFRASPGSVETTFKIYNFTYDYITNNNRVTTYYAYAPVVTDTTADLLAGWQFDYNDNCTVTLQYKKQSEESWTTVTTSYDRVGDQATGDATGLEPGTWYDMRATYADADGVQGTNPIVNSFQTTLSGIDTSSSELTLTAVDIDQIDVVATYEEDGDDDSSATVRYRSLGSSSIVGEDTFADIAGTSLVDHTSDSGHTWVNHQGYSGVLKIGADGKVYSTSGDVVHLVYLDNAPPTADYDVEGTIVGGTTPTATTAMLALRINTSANTYYMAGWERTSPGQWRIYKVISGTSSLLGSAADTLAEGEERHVRFTARGSTLELYVDGIEVISVTDSAITAAGRAGLRYRNEESVEANGAGYKTFEVTGYSSTGAWSSTSAMTADRPNSRFTASVTGLDEDTSYEVEVTFSDSGGFIAGTDTIAQTTKTLGPSIRLVALAAQPSDTSAIITVDYEFDTNEDSSCTMQYRSIRENLWTTVNASAITINRVDGSFRTTLTGLSPNITYLVRAEVSDPDGVAAGSESSEQVVFTTTGTIVDPDKRSKHYIYKIYDSDDQFISTWNDAPEPSFRLYQNGGTSDLTVTLPRRIASVHSDPTIDFANRVDIIAIDGQSDGMGKSLLLDSDMDLGSWTLTTDWSVGETAGPDSSSALVFSSASTTQRRVESETINLSTISPLVVKAVAKARGGKLRLDIAAYDEADALIEASDDNAETVGPNWQTLRLEWLPPANTAYVRVRVENVGAGTMYIDKVTVLPKELLIYRGRIESYNPRLQSSGESVEIEVFGLASRLTDTVVPFLQYATTQPSKDLTAGRPKYAATDPSNMLRKLIDLAQQQNPAFDLYYTDDSIKTTGTIAEYTFRDQELRDAFDKVRNLCPPGWHYFVEPDGKVWLRGPEHVVTHKLRLHIEVMEFENPKSIKSLKNYIVVRGRQDEDESEPDGFGSINYTAFDQASIDLYGLRMHTIRDGDVKDPSTAEIVGDGRLEELNRPEQRGSAYIPDEKDLRYTANALRGYNIEAFQPGDMVRIYDPISGAGRTYWDQFEWDEGRWDSLDSKVLPEDVPINTVNYDGTHVTIELSQRQPDAIGDFARLLGWQRQMEKNITD
jgi:hypothetical protein